MTKVYCSISKTAVFKNFVPKQGLSLSSTRAWFFLYVLMYNAARASLPRAKKNTLLPNTSMYPILWYSKTVVF
jgi:hypothetical protein